MVDYDPWSTCDIFLIGTLTHPIVAGGNYTNTIVQGNTILGGFAPYHDPPETKGENRYHAIIKSVMRVSNPRLPSAEHSSLPLS